MAFDINSVLLRPEPLIDQGERVIIDRLPAVALNGTVSEVHDAFGTKFDYLEHYEKDAEVFDYFERTADPATAHENLRLHETILDLVPKTDGCVLDVGCGKAWVAEALTARGYPVVSFDVASANLRKAMEKIPSSLHFAVRGDVLRLPFRQESFDTVISSEVMEHVPHLREYLENIIRVLKPGGRAIITTPYDEKILYSLCVHCNRQTPQHAHLHSFKEDSLDRFLYAHPGVRLRAFSSSNKALLLLRTHVVLRHLTYKAWHVVDQIANALVNKPARMVYVLDKPG